MAWQHGITLEKSYGSPLHSNSKFSKILKISDFKDQKTGIYRLLIFKISDFKDFWKFSVNEEWQPIWLFQCYPMLLSYILSKDNDNWEIWCLRFYLTFSLFLNEDGEIWRWKWWKTYKNQAWGLNFTPEH